MVKVVRAKKLLVCLLGCYLSLVVAPAFAQEDRARPSWSEDVKKTEIPDAHEEQERPQMEFSVDRSALQGDMPSFQRTPARSDTVEETEAIHSIVEIYETSRSRSLGILVEMEFGSSP